MKKFLLTVLTTLVIISLPFQEVKAQDPITNYDGIPLVVYWAKPSRMLYPDSYQQIRDMGAYGIVVGDVFDAPQYLGYFTENNVKVIPAYNGGTGWVNPEYAYIFVYTEGHYTTWEAEGTDPANGKATLYYNTHYTSYFNEGDTIQGRWAGGSQIPDNKVLIYGPGYPQNAYYNYNIGQVDYRLDCKMKIDTITTPPPGFLDDTVCVIKVTNLKAIEYALGVVEETVDSFIVKVSDFNDWDIWTTIDTTYNLVGFGYDDIKGSRAVQNRAGCVEFKIIWSGLDYLNLYIDKIRVSDQRGRDLLDPTLQARIQIKTMVENYATDTTIIGWYGLDEPGSIDNYEPFRVVDSLIQSVLGSNVRLHTGFFGGYNGKYRWGFWAWDYPDTLALRFYQDEEFWLRAKQKNIQINLYSYYYPWRFIASIH